LNGTLYIGIDDDGKVLGLQEDYKTLEKPNSDRFRLVIKNSLESYLKNKIIFDYVNLDFPVIDGKEICMIRVSSTPVPIFVRDGDKQECYVRVDNESKPYSYDEFIEYWHRHITKG
jgi:predicted HTH transcriptional regulator